MEINATMFRKSLILAAAIIFSSSLAQARDQIKIVGSSTVYPFATTVAEKFGKKTSFKTQLWKVPDLEAG